MNENRERGPAPAQGGFRGRPNYAAMANLTVASFMTVLNTNMIRVAVGELLKAFEVSISRLTWVFTAYTLVYAVLMPVFGRVGDMYGRKKLFLAGMSIFVAGSALCSVAWSFGALVMFRCVQALGSAMVFPNALVMATGLFGPEHRGRALGIWAASSSLGSVIGPTVGGFLAQYLAWRSIFYVNIPIGCVALTAGCIQLKETLPGRVREPFDVAGALTLGAGMVSLLLYLTGVQENGWGGPRALFLLGSCAIAVVLFVRAERGARNPMIDLQMFANPAMLKAFSLGMIHNFCGQGSTFMLPLFLTEVRKYSPAVMGLVMFPGSLVGVVGGPISGTLADRYGSRRPVAAGMLARAVANALFALLSAASQVWTIISLRFITVFGGSATWSPLLSFVLAENPAERSGVVTGVFNMVRMIGGILGTTLTGIIIDAQMDGGGYAGGTSWVTPLGGAPGFFPGFLMLSLLSAGGVALALRLSHSADARARVAAEQAASIIGSR